jgi:uncharacterized protein (DUF58 family)
MRPIAADADWRVDAGDLIALRARAARLGARTRQPSCAALAGLHRSQVRGRGMDYRESRHYQAGDDIRTMDWRVTARAGHAHVKVFDEERERPVVVVGDFGPSLFFASQGAFKSVLVARLAALIGWAAVQRGDRIGALLFNGQHREIQPAGGRRGQMRLIRTLVEAGDPASGLAATLHPGELSGALARLRQVIRPGSLVWLLSDFAAADAETARHLRQLTRHNQVLAMEILDPLELAPPPPGRYRISDGRHSGLLDTLGAGQRARYQRDLTAQRERVRALLEGGGLVLHRCLTSEDPAVALSRALSWPRRSNSAPEAAA